MSKVIKAQAKHNCTVFYSSTPFGQSHDKKKLMTGQVLELELVATEKIADRTISVILGNRNVILKEGNQYVSTFSGDFNFNYVFQ